MKKSASSTSTTADVKTVTEEARVAAGSNAASRVAGSFDGANCKQVERLTGPASVWQPDCIRAAHLLGRVERRVDVERVLLEEGKTLNDAWQ